MLNEQTLATLNALKLFGMARGLEERLNSARQAELSHADFVGLLVQDERSYRDNKRLKRLLRNAKLRQPAALEDIDYRHARDLSRQVMMELGSTQWIDAHRNVLITGFGAVCPRPQSDRCRRGSWWPGSPLPPGPAKVRSRAQRRRTAGSLPSAS